MVQLSIALLGLVAVSVNAMPTLVKRIAQSIPASTAKWEQACRAAGGGQRCNPLSITAFTTLLASAGPCEQQDAADALVDLGKELNSNEMIVLSQIFAQQPRNTPNSVAIPYCQQAPKNAELQGLFQCQFAGANQNLFAGGVALGGSGTIPFGRTSPVSPLGSCQANPSGPVPDGQQLVDITANPNTPTPDTPAPAPTSPAPVTTAAPESTPVVTDTAPPVTTTAAGGAGDVKLANGQAAQKLNAKFASLTTDSACTAGENACVGTSFAQCVDGNFITTSCGAALTCAALPLVNTVGTSITCTTVADAEARIAASGATGGLTGSGGAAADAGTDAGNDEPAPTPTPSPVPASGDFKLQNGKDAQALNAEFTNLNANSTCAAGENACVDGGFAQCIAGKFVVTPCSATLTCAALPLINKPGTSITCTTQADALARIQASGATGGITGA